MRSRALVLPLLVAVALLAVPASATAGSPPNALNPGTVTGGQSTAPSRSSQNHDAKGNCSAAALVLNSFNPFSHCNAASQALNVVGVHVPSLAGAAASVAGGLAGDVMDQVASWMMKAAQTVDQDVMTAATATTTPELSSAWFEREFGYLAFFGAALAGIVALLGIVSASLRGDPHALGEIFYGILRAGLITAMVISLTLLALKVADGVSGDVAQHTPKAFFNTLASAWGSKGWGGFGASALAFLTALLEVVVAILLWLELLFRDAAIYVAVLFFPITLAMAIWPRVGESHAKLIRILAIFIAFKPVALIVMMTGANLLLGGISFYGGVAPSVGTILVGLAVLSMAAFAPWSMMHLAGLSSGVMSSSGARQRARMSERSTTGSHGTVGGELFGGMTNYGASAAAVRSVGGTGGPASGGRQLGSAPASAGTVSSGLGRVVPGPIAAAAGLLPAGWQAAQTAGGKAQNVAAHGAARVHTAAGHGGSMPPSATTAGTSSRPSGAYDAAAPGPPAPPQPMPTRGGDPSPPPATGGLDGLSRDQPATDSSGLRRKEH